MQKKRKQRESESDQLRKDTKKLKLTIEQHSKLQERELKRQGARLKKLEEANVGLKKENKAIRAFAQEVKQLVSTALSSSSLRSEATLKLDEPIDSSLRSEETMVLDEPIDDEHEPLLSIPAQHIEELTEKFKNEDRKDEDRKDDDPKEDGQKDKVVKKRKMYSETETIGRIEEQKRSMPLAALIDKHKSQKCANEAFLQNTNIDVNVHVLVSKDGKQRWILGDDLFVVCQLKCPNNPYLKLKTILGSEDVDHTTFMRTKQGKRKCNWVGLQGVKSLFTFFDAKHPVAPDIQGWVLSLFSVLPLGGQLDG